MLWSIVPSLSNLSSFTTLQAHSSLYFGQQESLFVLPTIRNLPHGRKLDIGGVSWCGAIFSSFLQAATNLETLVVRDSPHLLQEPYPVNVSIDRILLFVDDIYPTFRRLRLDLVPFTVPVWDAFIESSGSSLTHLCVATSAIDFNWTDDVVFPGHLLPNLTHFALKFVPSLMMRTLRRPLPPKVEHLTLSILIEHLPPPVFMIQEKFRQSAATVILGALEAMMQTRGGKLKTIRLAENAVTSIVRERVHAATDGVLCLRSGHLFEAECTVDDAPGWCLQREDIKF
ncbi:hypothetical protein OF83DRAFT_1085924 [Amylostereum chailletii]|nr:hypothetical protein OF83DRAFT_1085924 [Amylostereum chailletii]